MEGLELGHITINPYCQYGNPCPKAKNFDARVQVQYLSISLILDAGSLGVKVRYGVKTVWHLSTRVYQAINRRKMKPIGSRLIKE
jgi:hypothetical protein